VDASPRLSCRAASALAGFSLVACVHAAQPPLDPRAPCATLERASCLRARALVIAAATYADEQHDLILAGADAIPTGTGLRLVAAGWRATASACARVMAPRPPAIDASAISYAFAGVAVDGTLVAASADLAPLLGAPPASRNSHEVRLIALAVARDPSPPSFEPTTSVTARASDDSCSCGDATHFAGATRFGATLSFDFHAPRDATHERAIDFVRRALGDARYAAHESNTGLAIDGLASLLDGDSRPLVFHLTAARPVAYVASPLLDVCAFPTPEISPASVDFGVAPYETQATRTVHVVNRAGVPLQALVGAETVELPARAAIDLPLVWTPEGDALRCETQTRDESILFVPARRDPRRDAAAPTERRARVFETIRTGRPHAEQTEHVDLPIRRAEDYAATGRDWTCPGDYVRTSCRIENAADGVTATADPRGQRGCHFSCVGPVSGKNPLLCRFDAVMECALKCP
jgi:hypothetical protein